MQQRNKQLSRESNLDYLHGRSAPWPRCHAAKDNIKWENFFPQVFFLCFSPPNGIFITRNLRHLFVSKFFKNTVIIVINMIRITFTVFHIVKEDILKVLPQNQRREWWQKLNLFFFYGGNFRRHFLCLSLRGALAKIQARVTRDGTICAKNSTFDYLDETNPIIREGIELQCPSPITAPVFTFLFLLEDLG